VLDELMLPPGLEHVRTTPVSTAASVPPGLLRAHRIAPEVWGRLRVLAGSVTFVLEETGESRRLLEAEVQVIEPDVAHRVEPGTDAEFEVEFYR
jgi:tellurite resistance-related uncharacterized protein